jgi:hypothetical protein
MNKRLTLLIILVLTVIETFAQINFRDGLIVTNGGDTLKGFVEHRETDLTPASIRFKSSLAEDAQSYDVSDVSYFSLKGIESYERHKVSISMDPVTLKEAVGYKNVPAVEKAVFLKVLQQGKVISLFSYRDDLKMRFYVLEPESFEPQELVYKILKVGVKFAENFAFRDYLLFSAEKSGVLTDKLKSKIKKIKYTENQLLTAVSEINGIEETRVKILNKASTGLWAGAGINVAQLHYYGDDEYAKNAQSSPSSMYFISIGYDLAKNPYIGKMVFRTDISVSLAEFATTTHDYRYSSSLDVSHVFKQNTLSLGVYALYNIYNRENLRLFISAGVRANFSSYVNQYELRRSSAGSVDILPNKDAEPRKIWPSLPVKAGVVVLRKVEIGVMYSPNMVLSHGDFVYKFGINSFQVGASYHFLVRPFCGIVCSY